MSVNCVVDLLNKKGNSQAVILSGGFDVLIAVLNLCAIVLLALWQLAWFLGSVLLQDFLKQLKK